MSSRRTAFVDGFTRACAQVSALCLLASGCADANTVDIDMGTPEERPTVKFSTCLFEGTDHANRVSGSVWHVLDHPEVPAAVSQHDGFLELRGLPPNQALIFQNATDDYARKPRMVVTGTADFHFGFLDMERLDTLSVALGYSPDYRRGELFLTVHDRERSKPNTDPRRCEDNEVGVRIANIEVAISPSAGASAPCYPAQLLDPECKGEPGNNIGRCIVQTEPGWVDATIVAPPDLECDGYLPGADGWQLAWPVEGKKNTFRFYIQPGDYRVLARAYCSAASP